MRSNFFIVLTYLFGISSISSQELIMNFENTLKSNSSALKGVIPIVNEFNNDIAFFLIDAKKVYGYLFNEDFQITKKLNSDDRRRKYKVLAGSSISEDNDYRIYITNNKHNKIASINFSFKDGNSEFKEVELNFDKERFIQTISHNNKFYLITSVIDSSIINIYEFDNDANYVKNEIDLTGEKFLDKGYNKTQLHNLLISVRKIEDTNPNSIDVTSGKTKLYIRNEELLFSFDQNKAAIQLVSINLKSYKYKLSEFEKPLSDLSIGRKKTNSYIQENLIYMIASTNDEFKFTISDYKQRTLIKEYAVKAEDPITFKNTPIIQVGGAYDSYREMEKTKKFLRKITAGDIGISAYKVDDVYKVTLGGKVETRGTSGFGGFGTFNTIGAGVNIGVFFNPTFYAYSAYVNTKSTHIDGLFDLNFNHLEGEIKANVFDKIDDFVYDKATSPNGETVFKYKDYYILGNYFSWDKEYTFHKFEN